MKVSPFLLLVLCAVSQRGFGFTFLPASSTPSSKLFLESANISPAPSSNTVETISIRSLESNHETEGLRMAASVALWLDNEWMPLDVHKEIAETVKASYIEARNANEHEVSVIMFKIAQDLEMKWAYFEQLGSFTNPWDIANYVSDYLAYRIGIKGCECSAKIIDPALE